MPPILMPPYAFSELGWSIPFSCLIMVMGCYIVFKLLRFNRVVSKSWKSLISSSYFIDCHFDRSAANRSKLGIVLKKSFKDEHKDEHRCSISFHTLNFSANSLGETTIIDHTITNCEEVDTLSWCRGLLLLRVRRDLKKYERDLLLWNPSTRECKEVPNPIFIAEFDYNRISASALGYDFTLKTHKIVAISHHSRHSHHILVYNVKTNSWAKVKVNYKDHEDDFEYWKHKTIFNGAPHWLIRYGYCSGRDSKEIEYFDFAMNKFEVVPQPGECNSRLLADLFDMEGCLCVGYSLRDRLQVWVMKEYGVKESWSKWMEFRYDIKPRVYPICLSKNVNVLLAKEYYGEEKKYAIYNGMERGIQLEILTLTGSGFTGKKTCTFVESLISLNTEKVEEEMQEAPKI
ncbi:hypothetical protein COLO4_18538 [Corchorus olitorius]|uniref:F-box associated beta-propeller type 1 domain-containing protein n=1 Tax=Corchorus olitorius TaxID=93759 RepID=A0A1R3J8M4_9ROSI|nr:hypothetical protein COLO4_18538 [Corchorus olitorius]